MSRARHGALRRHLEITLVAVALVSVLLLSGVNYVFARNLILQSVEDQMEMLGDTRVESIDRSIDRVGNVVSTIALTPSVITAMNELAAAYNDIDTELTDEQRAELESTVAVTLDDAGATAGDATPASVLPESVAGRYVQYHYIAENDVDPRDGLDDAGDGSSYSAAHATFHPLLRSLMLNARMSDLLLVDVASREVVYSTEKRIDLGTNVTTGPWSTSELGRIIDRLADTPIGDTVISDTSLYVPADGRAVQLLATAIRDGSDLVGAVITELPVAVLTELVTADESWEPLGLGDTGDVYLVGSDGTLRTEPRVWLDDPDRYLAERTDDDGVVADEIRRAESPVLLERVDNEAVDAALSGERFLGSTDNFLGDSVLTAARPVGDSELGWVVVVEQSRSETTGALRTLLRGTLLVIALLLPASAFLAWWLARGLTRPFDVLMGQAARIARGDPARDVEDLGHNELGDLSRQLESVAGRLAAEEQAIAIEEQQISELLEALVPARLVESVRRGDESVDDLVDVATVISISVDGLADGAGADHEDVVELLSTMSDGIDDLTERHGVEVVRRSTSGALFAAGLGTETDGAGAAAQFAIDALDMVEHIGNGYGRSLEARVGLAVGEVATGVIGKKQLTFGMWGDAVATAVTLSSMAAPGMLLAHRSVVDLLDDTWSIDPAPDGANSDIDARVIAPHTAPATDS